VQALSQHTPCAEQTRPEAHWLVTEQGPPLGSRPHDPLMQVALFAHIILTVHVALHAPTPHAYGKHDVAPGVTHLPAPSHVD
jgi:hypothetical protein